MTIREFAQLVGKLASTLQANEYGQVYLKRLETAKAQALRVNHNSYEGQLTLTDEVRQDLLWWLTHITGVSRPINRPNPHLTMYTDASFKGWGCYIPQTNTKTGGRWGPQEQLLDINGLELSAVLLSLQSCCAHLENKHILIQSDNTTTVVSVNRQGSTHSPRCNAVARQIWIWAIKSKNWLSATHCPGVLNVEADLASRIFNDTTEWMLSKYFFRRLCYTFMTPDIDLFASRLNFQIKQYCAWQPDPGAFAIDSFTLDWSEFNCVYVFPPFSVVGKALQKIETDRATAIVVVPDWPTQPWYSKLQLMTHAPPLRIPVRDNTLQLQHDLEMVHPLSGKLTLLACMVQYSSTRNKECLSRWPR